MCAHEAIWRLNENRLHNINPNVIRLMIHLENEQPCQWTDDDQMLQVAQGLSAVMVPFAHTIMQEILRSAS